MQECWDRRSGDAQAKARAARGRAQRRRRRQRRAAIREPSARPAAIPAHATPPPPPRPGAAGCPHRPATAGAAPQPPGGRRLAGPRRTSPDLAHDLVPVLRVPLHLERVVVPVLARLVGVHIREDFCHALHGGADGAGRRWASRDGACAVDAGGGGQRPAAAGECLCSPSPEQGRAQRAQRRQLCRRPRPAHGRGAIGPPRANASAVRRGGRESEAGGPLLRWRLPGGLPGG